jgi:Na+-transporting NADH:ubiquinone oxidoreductase subunit NqrB
MRTGTWADTEPTPTAAVPTVALATVTMARSPRFRVSALAAARRVAARAMRCDPRVYQIATLASLLTYGVLALDFDVGLETAVAIVSAALATQLVCGLVSTPRRFDPRSALISALSLCLLLRAMSLRVAIVTAVIAIASKFLIRVRGKHLFNPTNGAIVVMLLATGQVWVSPGQWGSGVIFAFLLASAGGLVVNRAARADVTWTFLACWAGLLVGRSLWLGEPLAIPLHRLESGALVLFSFFMISDPRTTPDSRVGRILFAVLVALGAYLTQFWMFRTNALLWSLAVCSLIVPVIDRLWPGTRYQWRRSP